jgi:hypothetical protein
LIGSGELLRVARLIVVKKPTFFVVTRELGVFYHRIHDNKPSIVTVYTSRPSDDDDERRKLSHGKAGFTFT